VAPFEFALPRLLTRPWTIRPRTDGTWRLDSEPEKNAVPDPQVIQANRRPSKYGSRFEKHAVPDPTIFHALVSGHPRAVDECVDRSARRLRSFGRPVIAHRSRRTSGQSLAIASSIRPERLLAAMLLPLDIRTLDSIVNAVLYPPELAGASL